MILRWLVKGLALPVKGNVVLHIFSCNNYHTKCAYQLVHPSPISRKEKSIYAHKNHSRMYTKLLEYFTTVCSFLSHITTTRRFSRKVQTFELFIGTSSSWPSGFSLTESTDNPASPWHFIRFVRVLLDLTTLTCSVAHPMLLLWSELDFRADFTQKPITRRRRTEITHSVAWA